MKATFLTLLVVVALGAVAPAEAMTNASAGSLLAYVCATKAGTVKVATSAASCGPNEQAISLLTGDYKDLLASAGTINGAANPVDWTQLKNVPPGFADGVGVGTALAGFDDVAESLGPRSRALLTGPQSGGGEIPT